jgi:uncharacterized membrane protein
LARAEPVGDAAVPGWIAPAAITLALAALAISAYLTLDHYTARVTLACSDSGIVNCAKVTTSSYSKLAGIPLPVIGLAYFLLMLLLDLPAAWRSRRPGLRAGRLAAALGGVGFALYLVSVELLSLDAICLWCSVVHVLTLALFAVVALGTALTGVEVVTRAETAQRPAPPRNQPG